MYIWLFSRSVGADSATTRNTRGLTRSVMRLIVPPFPAVSRPSKTMQTLAPERLTHSCMATSSPWSRSSSASYSLRPSLAEGSPDDAAFLSPLSPLSRFFDMGQPLRRRGPAASPPRHEIPRRAARAPGAPAPRVRRRPASARGRGRAAPRARRRRGFPGGGRQRGGGGGGRLVGRVAPGEAGQPPPSGLRVGPLRVPPLALVDRCVDEDLDERQVRFGVDGADRVAA